MAKEKQYVFSARTTEEGLKALNEVKARLKISWDEFVIDAMCTQYNLDKAMMSVLKKEKPVEAEQPPTEETQQEQPAATEQERPPKKQKKGEGRKASKPAPDGAEQ